MNKRELKLTFAISLCFNTLADFTEITEMERMPKATTIYRI